MTGPTAAAPSAVLPAQEVLTGELLSEISMEPVVSGAPFAYETVVYDGPEGFFAVWACAPGVYPRVKDKRGSFMYIISGAATITDDDGTSHELTADSVIVLPYGWVGRWDIRETIRKVYLHTTPVPPFRDGVQPSVFTAAAQVRDGGPPVRVSPWPVVSGTPFADGPTVFDGPDGHCAILAYEPGVRPYAANEHGFFGFVLAGEATVTAEDGTAHELTAGSVVALPCGWAGRWEIRTAIRVFYVRTTPAGERAADG